MTPSDYQYYLWEHWRENGGLPSQRPPQLPFHVPATWWVLYKIRHPKKPAIQSYTGIYARHKTALFRTPGGNIENVGDQVGTIGISALNLRAQGQWNTQRNANATVGLISIPWQQCFVDEDIDAIFHQAPLFNVKGHCAINVEQEILTTLPTSHIRERIDNYKKDWPEAEVVVIPLPWIQNGQNWQALKDIPVLIEVFTNAMPQFTTTVCITHAKQEGLNLVGPMYGAYPVNGKFPNPNQYPIGTYRIEGIYTGDDVQNWEDWK